MVFWSVAQTRLSLDTAVSSVNLNKMWSARSFAAILKLQPACQSTVHIRKEDTYDSKTSRKSSMIDNNFDRLYCGAAWKRQQRNSPSFHGTAHKSRWS